MIFILRLDFFSKNGLQSLVYLQKFLILFLFFDEEYFFMRKKKNTVLIEKFSYSHFFEKFSRYFGIFLKKLRRNDI